MLTLNIPESSEAPLFEAILEPTVAMPAKIGARDATVICKAPQRVPNGSP